MKIRCPACGGNMTIRRTFPVQEMRKTTSERVCGDCEYRETLLETVVSSTNGEAYKSAYKLAREIEKGAPVAGSPRKQA